MPMYISQPPGDAIVFPCELFVIDSQQVQNRGIQVVDHQRLVRDPEAQFVGEAIADSTAYTSPGQECINFL